MECEEKLSTDSELVFTVRAPGMEFMEKAPCRASQGIQLVNPAEGLAVVHRTVATWKTTVVILRPPGKMAEAYTEKPQTQPERITAGILKHPVNQVLVYMGIHPARMATVDIFKLREATPGAY
jgi:hypothetical protein